MLTINSLPFILILSVLSAAIIAMHALANFTNGRASRLANPIGVVIHVLATVLFLFTVDSEGKALTLDLVVLYFLLSILTYILFFFVGSCVAKWRESRKNKESEVSDE